MDWQCSQMSAIQSRNNIFLQRWVPRRLSLLKDRNNAPAYRGLNLRKIIQNAIQVENTESDSLQNLSNRQGASSISSVWGRLVRSRALFVGEGNLSFSRCVASNSSIRPAVLIATTYERSQEWSDFTRGNASELRRVGAVVMDGVDATRIDTKFPVARFDVVVFQFPNTGDRRRIRGRNSNFILVRRFLKSALSCLTSSGSVMISAVDSPHYAGCFQFPEAAEDAGFRVDGPFPFDPDDFAGYQHTNTNDDDSALEGKTRFGTWVFTPLGRGIA